MPTKKNKYRSQQNCLPFELKLVLSFIAALLLLFSCNTQSSIPIKDFRLILPDTSMTGGRNWEYKMSLDLCNQLNISTLDKGVDSFEIRWWFPGFLSFDEIFDIRYCINYGWIANKTTFFRSRSNKNPAYRYIIDSSFSEQIHTTTDISKIVDTIKSFDILHIPSQRNIPNFSDRVTDGTYIIIEIATKDFYKLISYHCPDAYKNESNNLLVLNINKFLSAQFGGPYFHSPASPN